ncbi:MAG: SDR family NAD(P)-dependent oxidoreductase [Bacteroidia bacterium]|jgi:NAD(P)-dependent dehydrogenase (short-subunit alcohol dehydrogenase family)|nr:SDR family NAD(P)-dependent oxidoreductase [Bacteroidia bacterium]
MNKTLFITGATSGIGYAVAHALASFYNIIFMARDEDKADALLKELNRINPQGKHHYVIADANNLKAIKQACDAIKKLELTIDVMVHNAGAFFAKQGYSADGYEQTLAVNHIAPQFITEQLLSCVSSNKGISKIIFVSSDAHKIAGIRPLPQYSFARYSGIKAYANSKLYNILYSKYLASQSEHSVYSMHPGGVNTNFGKQVDGITGLIFRFMGKWMRTPEQGADTLIWLIQSDNSKLTNGGYYKNRSLAKVLDAALHLSYQQQLTAAINNAIAFKINY